MFQILRAAILSVSCFCKLNKRKDFLISKEVLVSIGVPTYNRPQELKNCLKNLINQTYRNIEIIVVDNNSDKNIIKNLFSSEVFQDERIKVIKNKRNIGILKNAELVLKYARGDFFCWVSDDDWRSDAFIEDLINLAITNPKNSIYCSQYQDFIDNCSPSLNHLMNKFRIGLLNSNFSLLRQIYFFLLDHAGGKCNYFYSLIKTSELKKINFYQISRSWNDLSMDRNIIYFLLRDNRVVLSNKKLFALRNKNFKQYHDQNRLDLNKDNYLLKTKLLLKDLINEIIISIKYLKRVKLFFPIILLLIPLKVFLLIHNRLFRTIYKTFFKSNLLKRNLIEKNAIKKIRYDTFGTKREKLHLKDVTLVAVATIDVEKAVMALRYSKIAIEFAESILISNYKPWNLSNDIKYKRIEPFNDVGEWGKFIIYDLHKYINSKYIILVHDDGFIVNPSLWDNNFLKYDFVGAPWPSPKDKYSYRTKAGEIVNVGNSVSLRSKKILEMPSKLNLPWQSFHGNFHEDGFLCVKNRDILISKGIKFADSKTAYKFSIETKLDDYENKISFAFHKWFENNRNYPDFRYF